MHLIPSDNRSLDEEARALDLGQSPAELVVLSFSDGDLAAAAAAHGAGQGLPTLRLANLAKLKHPYSVDLYVENVAAKARFVLVRLLGGLDYWRYGIEELAAAARRHGFLLAVIPGCEREDDRLDAASTVPGPDLRRLWTWFREGGPENLAQMLRFIGSRLGRDLPWSEPRALPAAGLHMPFCRPHAADTAHALIVFYRSALMAGDIEPVLALADALRARSMRVSAFHVTSLKDEAAAQALGAVLAADPPDVILNTTAFSARRGGRGTVLDEADVPVLQVIQSGLSRETWSDASRGLGAADLAMHVVLPEVDGRILAGAVSFKGEGSRHDAFEFSPVSHRANASRIAHVADLAWRWAQLRRKPRGERRLACVLSDYPGKGGRAGYAVGLDTPKSLIRIGDHLRREGFGIGELPEEASLMTRLTETEPQAVMTVADYESALAELPPAFVREVRQAWGEPGEDAAVRDGAFAFRTVRSGRLVIAVQPDRGRTAERRADYHDPALPPRHAYLAFYLWLRRVERIDAMIHLGTHGTLEWLPGKAVALSESCAPEAVLGPVPVIYPFIVNNPGEAAQAKRRIAAVTVGHLTPPMVEAGNHGAAAELEALFDEYAQADGMDRKRARLLASAILDKARETGLAGDCGVEPGEEPASALARLDAWLCDLKEARIGDGLHVFGQEPLLPLREKVPDRAELARGSGERSSLEWPAEGDEGFSGSVAGAAHPSSVAADAAPPSPARGEGKVAAAHISDGEAFAACGNAELAGLVAALDGRFVPPGPAGSPARGRRDVLPTGRNLFSVDPRSVPTRTAAEIGRRAAGELMTRYAQDHGEWPRRVVLDVWGSATMRTGGDDLAQAFALIGVRPRWDEGSTRILGYEILPQARLDWPRVDVTLRISGLFRDVFPDQIALFDAAVRAVAALDETDEENALAEARRAGNGSSSLFRVFGAAPDQYGLGIARALASGDWGERHELGEAYLAGSSHAYAGAAAEPVAAGAAFRSRVGDADAYLHMADLPESDVLSSDVFAEHQGGFAAAAAALGRTPAIYHGDATRPEALRIRALPEAIARALRARATNPRWIAGQMRHGYRGAAEIAETVDALFAFAATTDAVPSRHFDLMFDATLGDDAVRDFLTEHNPAAARAVADRFNEAARRGFWVSRRNSAGAILAELAPPS